MKLINKKTGEVKEWDFGNWYQTILNPENKEKYECSLKEYIDRVVKFSEEWCDVPEELKVGYIIDPMEEDCLSADNSGYEESDVERAKELGVWLEAKEKAEKAVEWLKARKVLFDDAKGFKPNWKDDQEFKWSVIWDCYGIRLFANFCFSETSSPGPYFATKEDAEASIKAHEKEWKIYLLGSDFNE